MIGDTSLRIVVCPDLRGSVARRNHCLTFVGNVVQVFLMFFVVDKSTETGQGALFIFRLVACLGTFDKDFFGNTGVLVLPYIAQTYSGLYLVYILSAGTAASESVPFDFSFVDDYIEFFSFGKHGHGFG